MRALSAIIAALINSHRPVQQPNHIHGMCHCLELHVVDAAYGHRLVKLPMHRCRWQSFMQSHIRLGRVWSDERLHIRQRRLLQLHWHARLHNHNNHNNHHDK